MKTIGIVVEYNPFHNGHLYQIEEAKRQTGADSVIVVMSGDFVQRGAPAFLDKYSRTKMALKNGVNVVIELPVIYACASAELFAHGAISVLDRLGCIDYLVFGSECGDIHLLNEIAEILLAEPKEYQDELKTALKSGLAFPLARTQALLHYTNVTKRVINQQELIELLSSPNNILGIEYIKALKKRNSTISPLTIKRNGAGYHNDEIEIPNASATAIRKNITQVLESFDGLPKATLDILKQEYQKTYPIITDDFSNLIYYAITTHSEDLTKYLDVTEDLSNRIISMCKPGISLTSLSDSLKTKHMVYTRITRVLFHILLGIETKAVKSFMEEDILYARILGFNKNSSDLLRLIKELGKIPLITKVADAKQILASVEYEMFLKDIEAAHLYQQIVYHLYGSMATNEFQHGPIIEK